MRHDSQIKPQPADCSDYTLKGCVGQRLLSRCAPDRRDCEINLGMPRRRVRLVCNLYSSFATQAAMRPAFSVTRDRAGGDVTITVGQGPLAPAMA